MLCPVTILKSLQDIGGSGPIHAVGGAAALVLSLALGPRDEKIQQKGSRVIVDDVNGHSVPVKLYYTLMQ